MSDHSELKLLAETALKNWPDSKLFDRPECERFIDAARPDVVLSLIAEIAMLRRDSERLDWLCGQSRPVVEGQTMSDPEGELAGYDWGVFGACSTVREAIDYEMTDGEQS